VTIEIASQNTTVGCSSFCLLLVVTKVFPDRLIDCLLLCFREKLDRLDFLELMHFRYEYFLHLFILVTANKIVLNICIISAVDVHVSAQGGAIWGLR